MAAKKAAKGSKARSKKPAIKDLAPGAGKAKNVVGGALLAAPVASARRTTFMK
jgi:hypothetical protein